ncbi:MAG: hypothetical protein GX562_05095, partial [Coriobacteriaceae bacterium]|nr:hypothetical protein [Coriobacteriaceae bacterium]
AVATFLTDDNPNGDYFDAAAGTLSPTAPATGYGQSADNKGEVLQFTVSGDVVTVDWVPVGD